MANIDQRKYLKKYLDEDDVKRHKKKSRGHSSSRSERVRIVDDDGEYKPSRKYNDDDDYILTGEDAPQIVGIVDDRPPELRAVEDFRNSSKWRSLETSGEKSRSNHKADGSSQRYTERRRSRSRSPMKRDYSPPRRTERRDPPPVAVARKRRSSNDYSPVRRKPEGESYRKPEGESYRKPEGESYRKPEGESYRKPEGESYRKPEGERYREANYSKSDKGPSYSYENNGRRREDLNRQSKGNSFGQHREAEPNYREGHDYQRSATYTRQHQPTYAQRNHHDAKRPDYASAQNGRSAEYHARENQHRIDNRYARNDLGKSNPFRGASPPSRSANISHRDDHERRRSPVRSSNPFRANRPTSLSPLPDKRGDTAPLDKRQGVGRPQRMGDGRSRFDGHGAQPSNYGHSAQSSNYGHSAQSSSYGHSAHPSHYDSKSSNPFRGQNAPPVARSSAPSQVRSSRTDTVQAQYRPPVERAVPQRGSYYPGYEKRPESSSQGYGSYRRSRSPIKSSIQIVNSAPQYQRIEKRYPSDRREQPMARSGGGGIYPSQQAYIPRKPPPSHMSNVKY